MKMGGKSIVGVYGDIARRYDYFMRVLASFAEIYNYDFSVSSLFDQNSEIRKNGIHSRISDYFEQKMNESEVVTKLYYNEVVVDACETHEYGYLALGHFDVSLMADMIGLALRLLEACGIKNLEIALTCDEKYRKSLENYFDFLDISYSMRDIHVADCEGISFEITTRENEKKVSLLKGGNFSTYAKKFSGLEIDVFGFFGSMDQLVEYSEISVDEKMLDVVVTYDTNREEEHALYLTQELRLNGFKTEYIKRCDKSYIKKYYKTKYVISVKESDMTSQEILLTDLYTNEKEKIKEFDLIGHLDMNF